jgi:hypothetical protein
MKLISKKDFNFIIYGSDYIDYCFGCFLLQQPKSKIKQQLEHGEVLRKMIMYF